MTTCRSCHEVLEPGWKKCPACRTPVDDATKCPRCGAGRKPHWKVCPECDADLPGEGTTIPGYSGPAGAGGYREVEPGHPWYPQKISSGQRAEAHRLGIPLVIEETRSGIVLVLVPGGTYWMGASPGDGEAQPNENPRHQVSVRPLFVGVGPVLQEQWEKVTGQNRAYSKGARKPVEQVSWNNVQEFAKKVNAGRSGVGLRLPSEAEWEYFARAGTTTKYWWGDDYRERMANGYQGGPQQTTVVGRYPANPWGLLDVTGNVFEWCQDNYRGAYGQAPTDGRAFENAGSSRVLRGGPWSLAPVTLRLSYRFPVDADLGYNFIGVRFVRDAVSR